MNVVAILKPERSGFTPEQVEALAEYLDGQVATKADITRIEVDLARVRADGRAVEQHLTAMPGTMMVGAVGTVATLR